MLAPQGAVRVAALSVLVAAFIGSGFAAGADPATGPDLYVVQPDGSLLPRAGVTWDELSAAGVDPARITGAEPIEVAIADLLAAGLGPNVLAERPGWQSRGDHVQTWQFPLAAAPPAWLTEELHERLSNGENVPLAEIDGFPRDHWPTGHLPAATPWTHIMAGMALIRGPNYIIVHFCTANFVYQANDSLYLGTAGHCVVPNGFSVWGLIIDPTMSALRYVEIGPTVMSTGSGGVGTDFALIRIRDEVRHLVDPRISVVDGPCGVGTGNSGRPVLAHGHGLLIGTGGTARAGTTLGTSANSLNYLMPVSWGDSGSAVRFDAGATGPAAAITTHGLPYVMGYGTTMSRAFALAAAAGLPVGLVDSPAC
jgi:hypothetical protein